MNLPDLPATSTLLLILLSLLAYLTYLCLYRTPHLRITGKYDVKKKTMRRQLPPYPNGWYNLMRASELKKEEVRAVDVAG